MRYQQQLVQTNNCNRAAQHILDMLCIFRTDLDSVFMDKKMSQDQKIAQLARKYRCLMELIGEQVQEEKQNKSENEGLEDLEFDDQHFEFTVEKDKMQVENIDVLDIGVEFRKTRQDIKKKAEKIF
ncbi:MAG: hypothetical protein EOM68_27080 [Spirochaetia bacterium]|nr:hypothetical protein [Spirochaetia bacterium]